jgi:hypothetical protein
VRNLYKALGLASSNVDEAGLRASIERCPSADVARRARAVLLDPARRRHYDTALVQLQRIAHLRANLGLDSTAAWTRSVPVDELRVRPEGRPSRYESLKSRLAVANGDVQRARTEGNQGRQGDGSGWVGLIMIVVALGALALSNCYKSLSRGSVPSSSTRTADPIRIGRRPEPAVEPAFTVPALIMPQTGPLVSRASSLAPLEIRTRDSTHAYYVKLVPAAGGDAVAEYFIKPGERLDALAPLGSYELRYAAGQTWYGSTHLFGPSTVCSRAESIFDFRQTSDGYTGYTVELFLQVNGNLRTSRLAIEDF